MTTGWSIRRRSSRSYIHVHHCSSAICGCRPNEFIGWIRFFENGLEESCQDLNQDIYCYKCKEKMPDEIKLQVQLLIR